MARTQTSDATTGIELNDGSSSQPLARRSLFGARSGGEAQPPRRFARLSPFWKALIITSFAINLVLIFIVLLLAGFVIQFFRPLTSTAVSAQGFTRDNVAELRSVVQGLENATIRTTIPIDQPLDLNGRGVVVPVDQATTVTLVEPVPLTLANADIDLGNGNRLRANNISLALPAGTQLNIALKMDIPLDSVTIPVVLNVPIEIPLKDTELGPEFVRLGQLVDRLAGPFGPFLGLDIPEAAPAPRVTPEPQP
jgi:hypothetical protein